MRPAPAGRFDRRLLAPMMLGAILNPINSSIIAVSLVPIGVAFGAPPAQTAWLISALYLATSIGQPLVGRLVDTFGPKRLSLVGAGLTALAGVLGVLAPNLGVLIAARVILGFGTCAGYPAAMFLIRSESTRTGMKSPASVLTALNVATQTIAVIGPTLGGFLIEVGGWRATIAVNIPLGVATFVLAWIVLPARTPLDRPGDTQRPRVDWPGILLFAATLVALLLFLMDIRVDALWLLALAAVAGALFTWRELWASEPFIDVRVFAGNLPLIATYARALLTATISYCFIYGFTQWVEDGRGLSPSLAGLVLLPPFAVGILVSLLTGRRSEVRGKLLAGNIAQLAACVLLLFLGDGSPVWLLFVVTIVLGIPQGLLSLANQNALYHQADAERVGASAGLLRTFMYLGAMVASSATGAFFGRSATTGGLHELGWFMVGASVLLLVLSAADRSLTGIGRKPEA